MAKQKTVFICTECGHQEPKWAGKCLGCESWNTLVESTPTTTVSGKKIKKSSKSSSPLNTISTEEIPRVHTGLSEVDRVLGGGVIAGGATLIGGEPGIGKSTLTLQLAEQWQGRKPVLIVSGEESANQLKLRADRLHVKGETIKLFCETDLQAIVIEIEKTNPGFLIIDSIQTIVTQEVGSIPGTVSQIKYCGYELISLCKEKQIPLLLTAHVTKEGQIAGPKVLEHLVDTVLYFEHGEGDLRILRTTKNRFGATDESGFFLMTGDGLKEVAEPTALFTTQRESGVPDGITCAILYEGSRSFPVEIQTLVTPAKGAISRTFSDRVESQRVSRLAAVLEKMLKLRFSDQDLYVNVAGGFRLTDQGGDLALIVALYSARTGISIPSDTIFCGEVSLAGEIRPIPHLARRIKSAEQAGYKKIYLPKGRFVIPKTKMELIHCASISEMIQSVFR